jgi:hypothetical protein
VPDSVPLAWDEADRLAALRGYDILDAPANSEFDDFIQIAAYVCETPIAVVNLIDETRQVFVAEIGLGVRETRLTSRFAATPSCNPMSSSFQTSPLIRALIAIHW